MAQLNDLVVTGSVSFEKGFIGTIKKATNDGDGNVISSTYMKKGIDYVTAGRKSGTTAGEYSTAEGYNTTASGDYSHAEGNSTKALGYACHAEGYNSTASGSYSHAEGYNTTASGNYSHAEGYHTTASGHYSHAEGSDTVASGNYSHAEGLYTIAASDAQFVCGEYNVEDSASKYAFIIGGGSSVSDRKNALTISSVGMMVMGYTNGVAPSVLPEFTISTNTTDLLAKFRYLNGCMGSFILNNNIGILRAGTYNYIYIPHRTGGENGAALGDNCNYGTLLMFDIQSTYNIYGIFYIRFNNATIQGPYRLF